MSKSFTTEVLSAGNPTVNLPCDIVWFTVSQADATTNTVYTIKFGTGGTVSYEDIAFTSPENQVFNSDGAGAITITWSSGADINVVYLE